MSKQYSYIERRIPATPRNKRLTDAIVAASSTGGGYIGGGGGASYWQLVTTDADGNALAEEDQYLVPVGAYPVVSLSDIVAYATTDPVANTPVTGYDTFGLVKIASGNGLIVTDGVLSIDPSAVGGLDEKALALYLTLNKYVTEDMLKTKGYLMLSSPLTGYVIADAYTAISQTDTVLTAIGKLERRFDGYVDLTTDQTIGGVKTFTETIFGNKDVVAYATSSAVANTPVASTTTFGLVKIGDNLTVVDGVISAVAQQSGVQFTPGTALELTANSVLNVKFGSTGTTACAGNDSRLSDARKCPCSLSWSGYSEGSYDGSEAKTISIPSNTSQLTNGAGYIKDGNGNFTSLVGSGNNTQYLAGNGQFYTIAASEISFPNGYVTLSTEQIITANKWFSGGLVAGPTDNVHIRIGEGSGNCINGYKADDSTLWNVYLNYEGSSAYTLVDSSHNMITTGDIVAYSTSSAVANTPVASTTTFGLVKIGSGISVSGGVISVSGTSGSGGTTVSWGSGDSNYYGLNVGGTSKNVSLYGHTHSGYALSSHSHSLSRTTEGKGNVVTNVTVSDLTVTVTYGSVSGGSSSWDGGTIGNDITIQKSSPALRLIATNNSSLRWAIQNNTTSNLCFYNSKFGSNICAQVNYSTGAWTGNSDVRLKIIDGYETDILNKIYGIDIIYYYWKFGVTNRRMIGVSAQDIRQVLPELVNVVGYNDNIKDYTLGLDYATLGAVVAIGGLKELYALHLRLANEVRSGAHWRLTKDDQIRQLQRECAELKVRINELEKGGAA